MKLIPTFILLFSAHCSFSQSIAHDQLKKLHFLSGVWKGEGWTLQNEAKQFFLETETALIRLDGAAFEIQALGFSKTDNTKKIVNAVALISYDEGNSKYLMRLVDGDGSSLDAYLICTDTYTLEWGLKDVVKFTIEINGNTWKETGYKNKSDTWTKTFEMVLTKQ